MAIKFANSVNGAVQDGHVNTEFKKVLAKHDRNGDGKLSMFEFAELLTLTGNRGQAWDLFQ